MVWHLDVGFSNIKKKDSYKWECSSHTLGTWAGFKTMEISLVYIFNTTIQVISTDPSCYGSAKKCLLSTQGPVDR
jgi:hypothetical protein